MYVFWLLVAICMIILFVYSEWKLTRGVLKAVYQEEIVSLPGKKIYYVYARFLNVIIGVGAVFFTLTSYAGTETVTGCWLLPALLVGLLVAYSTNRRGRFFNFENESDDD